MGASKKGKRKMIYKDREFYWYMNFTEDWECSHNLPQLNVVSEDKKFLISYQPQQKNDNPYIIIKGTEFIGLENLGTWERVKTPNWQVEKITPEFVRTLIDWCFDENKEIILVDWLGKII